MIIGWGAAPLAIADRAEALADLRFPPQPGQGSAGSTSSKTSPQSGQNIKVDTYRKS